MARSIKIPTRPVVTAGRDESAADLGRAADHRGPANEERSLKLMTVREAAEYAKVSEQTIRRWIKEGRLKVYRAGRQIRIDESDLIECLSSHELKWL